MADPPVARLLLALDQGPAAVLITDLAGRIEYVNQRFTTITGWTAAEAIGRTPAILKSGLTPVETYRELWRTIKSGRQWVSEIQNRRRNGELFTNAVTITPIRDASGAVTHYLGVQEDVTERRRTEAAARDRDELEGQLRQSQKMEALGQLAGGVAHDFNNILTAITGYAELLRSDLPAGAAVGEVDEILHAVRRAAALTRQLLAFSRKQVLQPVPLDAGEAVRNVEPMLRRLIGEHVQIDVTPDAGAGLVLADPGQLEQVLVNLVVNARDAMPQGGRITIATHPVELDATDATLHGPGLNPGPYVVTSVTDTGVGMSAEVRQRVFEPFFTTKPAGKGSGLGLATVYGIVKQSGGTVTVYSEPGTGSTFRVYLPRAAGERPRAAAPAAQPAAAHGSETILIVEDDEAVRALATEILQRRGYTVLAARTGEEAVAMADRFERLIQLVITDVVLTGIHGPEVARRIRQRHPALRVLFMSGYGGGAAVHDAVLAAGAPFLEKPFTAELLALKIREVLDSP